MSAWLQRLTASVRDGERCVVVTVAGTRGSTPREIGAKMLVTADETFGSVGGGQLEYQCVARAAALLACPVAQGQGTACHLERFVLGANCGQCCGGVAEILFEEVTAADAEWVEWLAARHAQSTPAAMLSVRQPRPRAGKLIVTADEQCGGDGSIEPCPTTLRLARRFLADGAATRLVVLPDRSGAEHSVLLERVAASDFRIAIFGAGHVGAACARVLATLDARVDLIDSRAAMLDGRHPDNVRRVVAPAPAQAVADYPQDTYFLIMTHDHGLDLELCARVLERGDFAYCGLIGSRAKRRRFDQRLRGLGVAPSLVAELTCPIGNRDINAKTPAHIAIAVAAQIVTRRERLAGVASAAPRLVIGTDT